MEKNGVKDSGSIKTDIGQRIAATLETADIFLLLHQLKEIYEEEAIAPFSVKISEDTFTKLKEFIREFSKKEHLFNFKFFSFMGQFIQIIEPIPITSHMACVAYLSNIDLEPYRKIYSYSRIYDTFKKFSKEIFSEEHSVEYSKMLIRLLDNNKLVYKNLLPLVTKFNLFISEKILDKNIASCCSAMHALIIECRPLFEDKLVLSLSCYLLDILVNPHNFLFLKENDMIVIRETFSAFIDSFGKSSEHVKSTIGMLRQLHTAFIEYRRSTVREEMLVVVTVLEMLTDVLNMALRCGCTDFSYISSIDFIGPDSVFLSAQIEQPMCKRYVEAKYRFINAANTHIKLFDRVQFYKDISMLKDQLPLFKSVTDLYGLIEWSDMIPFACQCKHKRSFLYMLFHPFYMAKGDHIAYINLFMKNIINEPETLLYFTAGILSWAYHGDSTDSGHCTISVPFPEDNSSIYEAKAVVSLFSFLPQLYFLNLGCTDYKTQKRRIIILRYLWNISEVQNHSVLKEFTEYISEMEDFSISRDTLVISIILVRKIRNKKLLEKIYRFLLKAIESYTADAEKEDTETSKSDTEQEKACLFTNYLALAAIILSKMRCNAYSIKEMIDNYPELVVGMLNMSLQDPGSIVSTQIKSAGFEILLSSPKSEIQELRYLLHRGELDKSKYYKAYKNIEARAIPPDPSKAS